MGFLDAIGKVINPKNILTAGGALVGGPLGAGIGRAGGEAVFGDDFVPFNYGDDPTSLGGVVGEGAMGAGTTLAGQSAMSAIKGAPETPMAGGGSGAAASGGMSGSAPGVDYSSVTGGPASEATLDSMVDVPQDIGEAGVAVPEAAGMAETGGGSGTGPPGSHYGVGSYDRAMMGLAGAQALGRIGSGLMEGEMAARRRERMERLSKVLAPHLKRTLSGLEDL